MRSHWLVTVTRPTRHETETCVWKLLLVACSHFSPHYTIIITISHDCRQSTAAISYLDLDLLYQQNYRQSLAACCAGDFKWQVTASASGHMNHESFVWWSKAKRVKMSNDKWSNVSMAWVLSNQQHHVKSGHSHVTCHWILSCQNLVWVTQSSLICFVDSGFWILDCGLFTETSLLTDRYWLYLILDSGTSLHCTALHC